MLQRYTREKGAEWSRRVLRYMRSEENRGNDKITYDESFRFILDQEKAQGQTYPQSDTTTAAEAYRQLGNIIADCKNSSGQIDINLAFEQLRNIDERTIYDAAQFTIDAWAHDWIRTQGLPGPISDHLSAAHNYIISKYSGTALAYLTHGRNFKERTLTEMYPQFFK